MNLSAPTTTEMLAQLKAWRELGCLRQLDTALARFMCELSGPSATPELLLACALTAHLQGLGHSCLHLELLCQPTKTALAHWPEAAWLDLQTWLQRLPRHVEQWHQTLACSTVVQVETQPQPDQAPPLVLTAQRLYLRRYWHMERQVVQHITQRLQMSHSVDLCAACAQLNTLFPANSSHFDWQKFSCAVALRSPFTLITGGPGTGKTYTVARLLALLWATHQGPQPLRVGLAAPTGKAAARLKQSIDQALLTLPMATSFLGWAQALGPARTLHAWLGARPHTRELEHHAAKPLVLDVLIVDEASMVDLEMMHNLLAALPGSARLVLLGDPNQLASVEAGAVLADLCRAGTQYNQATTDYALATTGQKIDPSFSSQSTSSALAQQTVMLRHSRRFSGPLAQLAQAVNLGDVDATKGVFAADQTGVLRLLEGEHITPLTVAQLAIQKGGYHDYLALIEQRKSTPDPIEHATWVRRVLIAFEQFRVLCVLRQGPWGVTGLNAVIEAALAGKRLIRPAGTWFEGRPVMVTRNDPSLGLFNGDMGIALKPATPNAPLRVYFAQGEALHSVSTQRLADVQTAFAMTVHKSQGSEFNHTVLTLPDIVTDALSRELIYTAITRSKKNLTLMSKNIENFENALMRPTVRFSGLVF